MSAFPSPAAGELSWDGAMRLLEALPALPLGERGAQIELLVRNASPGIREQVLRMGANLLPEERIAEHLHNDHDAVLRNAGLEMLKLRGARSVPLALRLLADPEPDVVLQAVLLLDHLRDPRALGGLRGLLAHPDLNVVQAAILAIGRLGDARSIPDLLPFLDGDPWLQIAAVQALGDLRSRRAVRDLARRLRDPVIGAIAAEALARIGGLSAWRALAAHWMAQAGQLDEASFLGLLAHVLEGLPRAPLDEPGRESPLARFGTRLADPAPAVSAAAARSILALGPSPLDEAALETLAALAGPPGGDGNGGANLVPLPLALRRRPDLITPLLARPGVARAWGFQVAVLHPRRAAPAAVLGALRDLGGGPETLAAAARFLARLPPLAPLAPIAPIAPIASSGRPPAELGPAVIDLYLGLPAESRSELAPVLRRHRQALRAALAARAGVEEADRVVLAARLGARPREVAAGLLRLAPAGRLGAILQLADHRRAMRLLPWKAWIRTDPETWAAAAAEVAAGSRLTALLPLLRALPPRLASPPLLRAFAELGDADAVPWLLALLTVPPLRPELRPLVIESLGRIGGAPARQALAAAAVGRTPESRLAYRALSLCAIAEDAPLFRAAVTHPDWYVRLACAEVLGRFAGPEDLEALARLAGDPVPAIAHRAVSCLAPLGPFALLAPAAPAPPPEV
jgi:HEAT repeat protein